VIEWNDGEGYANGGLALIDSNRNRLAFNRQFANPGGAIVLQTSSDNQIYCNDTTDHRFAVDVGAGSTGNTSWKNNHYAMDSAVDAGAPAANRFDRPAPTGGSHWQVNAAACADANADGFCDAPYRFAGNADALPRVKPVLWRVDPEVRRGDGGPQQQQQGPPAGGPPRR
jgi:nitrous oxidase accessory protein NosD